MDIVIEFKNLSRNFHPEKTSLRWLIDKVGSLFPKVDGQIRAIFTEAQVLEFHDSSGLLLPTEHVEVIIARKYVRGRNGMISDQGDFTEESDEIVRWVNHFLFNTNNGDLILPAKVGIYLGQKPHFYPKPEGHI